VTTLAGLHVRLATDARMVIACARGERVVPAAEFFVSHFTTALEPDELLVAVEVPVAGERTGHAFLEVAARYGDFALVGAAAAVTVDDDGVITEARIACTSVAPTPGGGGCGGWPTGSRPSAGRSP